jgi:hypothetical protein
MSKDLKKLSKITTRYQNREAYGFNSGGQTKVVNPINQKYDFKKPTVVSISRDEMELLHKDGRLEKDGITIIADE